MTRSAYHDLRRFLHEKVCKNHRGANSGRKSRDAHVIADHRVVAFATLSLTKKVAIAASTNEIAAISSAKIGAPSKNVVSRKPSKVAATSCGTTMKMLNRPI